MVQLSDMRDVLEVQKNELAKQDSGTERLSLETLPNIQTHALIISGIRRCGKSTLLHQFVKKQGKSFFYLNFDDLRLSDFRAADFQLLDIAIKQNNSKLLFFDEIQSADQWEVFVRQKLDEGFQVIITGSNASLLSRELGTKLTGRHITKELFPFSYQEYCAFTKTQAGARSFNAYLEKGGFPEYLKTGNPGILTQLQMDILHRDIAVRYKLRDVASLMRLFVYLVSNAAQLVSPSKLLQTAGVKSATTILEYFSYFESAYLLSLVPRFSWSVKKQSLAPKKVYIVDNGIIKTTSLSFTGNEGALLENFAFGAFRRHTRDIFYFAENDKECDFIINPHSAKPRCIQVCKELTIENKDREIRGLFAAMNFFDQTEGTIITQNTSDVILDGDKKILAIPAWQYDFTAVSEPNSFARFGLFQNYVGRASIG